MSNESGWFVVPFFTHIPGMGYTYFVAASAWNIAGTTVDADLMKSFGAIEGTAVGVGDITVIHRRLSSGFGLADIESVSTDIGFERGMKSKEDDYVNTQAKGRGLGGVLSYFFLDGKIRLTVGAGVAEGNLEKIRDKEGKEIRFPSTVYDEVRGNTNAIYIKGNPNATWEDQYRGMNYSLYYANVVSTMVSGYVVGGGVFGDYSDDLLDPRRGFRFGASYYRSKIKDSRISDPAIRNTFLSYYIPVLSNSTIVFNGFTSDAEVVKQGRVTADAIKSEILESDCSSLTGEERLSCEKLEKDLVDFYLASNKYGNATPLGGNMLRSYRSGRFLGAHTRFFGTEFRWNHSKEKKRVNYGVLGGLRYTTQWAFFYELGSIADKAEDLYKETRYSCGVGARIVLAGFIGRIDFMTGEEGNDWTITGGYPW
ncbi:MAG: hypothetical protein GY866_27450 [Proteobacteria bacterium]|nr:hypothetical protein [Pseudomonadota bacterium]